MDIITQMVARRQVPMPPILRRILLRSRRATQEGEADQLDSDLQGLPRPLRATQEGEAPSTDNRLQGGDG